MLVKRWRAAAAAGGSVIVSALTGVVTNLITSKWSATLGAALGALVVVGVFLQVVAAGHADGPASPQAAAREGSSIGQPAQGSRSAQTSQAGPDVIPQPPAVGAEMVYDMRLNPAKEILVRYIYQAADISMISNQSGLDQGAMAAGGAAVNYWQVVLERACLEGVPKVDAVLDRAIGHLKGTVAEAPLRAAVEMYRQARG